MTMFGRGAPIRKGKGWVAWLLAGLVAVPYLLAWASPDAIKPFLMFNVGLDVHAFAQQPWTTLTYPLAYDGNGRNAIHMILLGYWLYSMASMLERELGAEWLLGLYGIASLLHGLAAIAGGALYPFPIIVWSSWLPTAFLTLIWCARNQKVVMRFFAIIPVSGLWLGILTALLTMLYYGTAATYGPESRTTPLFGMVVIIPLALAWIYGLDKLPLRYGPLRRPPTMSKKKDKEFDEFINKVRDREKDRQDRDRLRKLFEESLDDDSKDR